MGVKEADAVLYGGARNGLSLRISRASCLGSAIYRLGSLKADGVPSLVSNRMWLARSFPRITGSRLDIVWMANYKAYKEGLEDMPHRC